MRVTLDNWIVLAGGVILLLASLRFVHRDGHPDWLLIAACMCFFVLGVWTRRRQK